MDPENERAERANTPRTIAAYAASDRQLDQLVSALEEAGPYEVVRLSSSEKLPHRSEKVGATVVLCQKISRDSIVLLSHLQEHGANVPLLVIGAEPPSLDAVSLWLPALPPSPLLGAVLDQLVASGPSRGWRSTPRDAPSDVDTREESGAKSWRRKTDVILGESSFTRRLLHELDRLAPSNSLVLVTGESGTGKELVARALHYCGPRAAEPFIAVDCAAIPETAVEGELFGHQRGAFPGAVSSRAGAFETAQKGTLFLDEIADMPRSVQSNLLDVLETHEFSRLGGNETRKVTARLVVATNRDLALEVKEGRFREDLYLRLKIHRVHLEPLRRRPEDIPAIVAHHLAALAARENRPTPRFTPAALEHLLGYSWPGNVRELVHVLGRALLVAPKNVIDAEHIDLPRPNEGDQGAFIRYRDAKHDFDRDYYTRLMRLANGNIAFAARLADKTRKEVYDALKRVGLDAAPYRQGTDYDDVRSSREN